MAGEALAELDGKAYRAGELGAGRTGVRGGEVECGGGGAAAGPEPAAEGRTGGGMVKRVSWPRLDAAVGVSFALGGSDVLFSPIPQARSSGEKEMTGFRSGLNVIAAPGSPFSGTAALDDVRADIHGRWAKRAR